MNGKVGITTYRIEAIEANGAALAKLQRLQPNSTLSFGAWLECSTNIFI